MIFFFILLHRVSKKKRVLSSTIKVLFNESEFPARYPSEGKETSRGVRGAGKGGGGLDNKGLQVRNNFLHDDVED